MTSSSKVLVEVELGKKGVEKTDILIYCDGRLIESHFDMSYNDISLIANRFKESCRDAEMEVWCVGEDCLGRPHRWQIDV